MTDRTITHAEFLAELRAQGVDRQDLAFKCPICATVQSMRSLRAARPDAADSFIEGQVAFSCIGRLTNAGSFDRAKDPPGKGCDWTLGGLLRLHTLTVITENDKAQPSFEIATREEAQALRSRLAPLTPERAAD